MTHDEFDALVGRIERRLGDRPWALRIQTTCWVALGYLGFLFWFLLVFAMGLFFFIGGVAFDTGWELALLVVAAILFTLGIFQTGQLLWVWIELQPGHSLEPSEAPELFALLAKLRDASKSPRFHQVRVTPDFNAGVQQIPRLGVFGWPRNYLYVGLPLLESLSPEQFEAVLAHEFAHLSARHCAFTAWVHRLRQTWERVFQHFHEPPKAGLTRLFRKLLVAFIDWYWPRFNAHAFLLARANEHTADHFSAEWAGAKNVAAALWQIACQGRRIEDKLWPDLWILANTQPQPPPDVIARVIAGLHEPPETKDTHRWMDQTVQTIADNLDTHPSLSDRLRALGDSAEVWRQRGFPAMPHPSAAAVLLADTLTTVQTRVQQVWEQEALEIWRKRHGRAALLEHQLATIDQAQSKASAECDPDLLWEQAHTTLDLDGPEAAEPLLRRLLAVRPTHSAANLVLGQHLLDQGKPDGEMHLRRILDTEDDELIPHACEVLVHHFQSIGRTDHVTEVRSRLGRYQAALDAADQERNTVTASDRLLAHDLTDEELAGLREVLAGHPDLATAYLARKSLEHFVGQRLFVLCVHTAVGFWGRSNAERDAALVAQLTPKLELPGRMLVIAPHGGFRALGRKLRSLPNARIYPEEKGDGSLFTATKTRKDTTSVE